MIDMFTSIYSTILNAININGRIYDTIAPQATTYPYIVIRYPSVSELDESTRKNYILEVDIYDNLTDTTRLETLTKEIDDVLDRSVNRSQYYKIYRNTPYLLRLPDEDEKLRRNQLRYIVHKF